MCLLQAVPPFGVKSNKKKKFNEEGERPVVVIGGFDAGTCHDFVAMKLLKVIDLLLAGDPRLVHCHAIVSVLNRVKQAVQDKKIGECDCVRIYRPSSRTASIVLPSLKDCRWIKSVWMKKVAEHDKLLAENADGQKSGLWMVVDAEDGAKNKRRTYAKGIVAVKEIVRAAGVGDGELEVVPQRQEVMWRKAGAVCATQVMHVKREDDRLNFDFARLWHIIGPSGCYASQAAMMEAVNKALTDFKPGASRG